VWTVYSGLVLASNSMRHGVDDRYILWEKTHLYHAA
jgi:hypothetical protein